jgi:hypothetical protein
VRLRSGLIAATLLALPCAGLGAPAAPATPPSGTRAVGKDNSCDPDNEALRRAPGSAQTSDGVRGETAPRIPPRLHVEGTYETLQSWQVVPGVSFEQFRITDARGPIRGQLMRIDPATPGLKIDYAGRRHVASTGPLLDTVLDDGAIAGVNGDFFDICDTGAPLGIGRSRKGGVRHGRQEGWNTSFYVDKAGLPHIGQLVTKARIVQHPRLDITNVNSPSVAKGGIGLYTRKWGALHRYRVVDGRKKHVRMVVIRGGRVLTNTRKFPRYLKVTGQVLVARGRGPVSELRQLTQRKRITTRVGLSEHPKVAITGNTRMLLAGRRLSVNDVEMHPRTAVGIDRDTGQVLLLVIDGRQDFSRGYTMVELANLMKEFGAEDALNLDGGGSSTMVGLTPAGTVDVLNSPSDGSQRSVPNGLELSYTAPPPA